MKSLILVFGIGLLSVSGAAHAQDSLRGPDSSSVQSSTRGSFDSLKTLAGTWLGMVETNPTNPELDGPIRSPCAWVPREMCSCTRSHPEESPSRP